MLRLGKLTDYATVILARLAAGEPARLTASQIALESRIALPTVSKLLKQLHGAGLLESTRGQHGGYRLARPARAISAAAILDAMEGPLALTECSGNHSQCDLHSHCGVGGSWQRINRAIRQALEEVTLAELAGLERNPHEFVVFDLRPRPAASRGAR